MTQNPQTPDLTITHYYPKQNLVRGYTEYKPRICFLWLSADQKWFDAIKTDMERVGWTRDEKLKLRRMLDLNRSWKPLGHGTSAGFSKGFPDIATFFDAAPRVVKVSKERSLALTNFTSWALKDRRKKIAQHFAKSGLILKH